MTGEFELIRKLIENWTFRDDVQIGPGDDASAVSFSQQGDNLLLQTTDLLIEGAHFKKGWGTPYQLGWKALSVNLSDIAAMGGLPTHTHLSLAIPATWTETEILDLMKGYRTLAERYQVSLLGGDLSRSEHSLMIAASVNGSVSNDKAILRKGADPGDVIWVSGSLGNAAAGLKFLKEGSGEDCPGDILDTFLQPQPDIELGLLCSQCGWVNAMIDISDGLAGDLGHILEASGVGATLEEASIPIDDSVKGAVTKKDWNLNDLTLYGGEDYRLLGCVSEANFEPFHRLVKERLGKPIFSIGRIDDQPRLRLHRSDGHCETISPRGHDHFLRIDSS